MKAVRSVRSMRVGIPAAFLGISALMFIGGLWQAISHRRTLQAYETCLRNTPRREELAREVLPLIRLLDDDVPRDESYEERLEAAKRHRQVFDGTLQKVLASVQTQRELWQDLMTSGRRRDPLDARALFMSLNDKLGKMQRSQALEDIGPPPPADAATAPLVSVPTRRTLTLAAFRREIFELLDLIHKSPDPALLLVGQFQDAADRVRRAFQLTAVAALLGVLLTINLHRSLRQSLWQPLDLLRLSLNAVAQRKYQISEPASAPREFGRMFGSLREIGDRSACGERDKDLEVSDRSRQRVRSERLAGIGLLATGVAHEINNPLGAIVGAADGLQYRIGDIAAQLPPNDAEIVREYLAMIQNEAKRCRGITTKLLDFARGRDGERALYDITAIVQEVIGMFRHVRQYQSRTIDMNRVDPCRAFCNGPEVKQVILNLVANALQATPDDGRLDIRVNPSPDFIEVLFQDTGSGMTSETLEHLFDPFFSTKGPGQGTGLGLSISHAIVEKHHGTLEAASGGPGQGSTFRLRLPASENAAQAAAERKAA